jgi:cysteine-rich repeat protein
MDAISVRWLRSYAVVACMIGVAACSPNDRVKQCSANGEIYFCPEETECGGVQQLCVQPGGCGNGVTENTEECDDGNINKGDGCSESCKLEVCGNGIMDPGERCDDGNTTSGDGCSADCLSDETCGNLRIDKDRKDARGRGEVCDDGNISDGDGCSADCRSTEICGNHIIDFSVGEVCDDGPGGSVACSANCRSNLSCNNLAVDPGEECDHGLFGDNNQKGNANSNDCRADCMINRCGDGFLDSQPGPNQEECDGAPPAAANTSAAVPTETATCNSDCTLVGCGDGKVNKTAGEECDDHNSVSGDGCSSTCKLEFCGDGKLNNGEACDRTLTPATCNLDCTTSECGDGKLNTSAVPPEQCDDGGTGAGDGCSPTCTFEHCGNNALDAGEECDGILGLQPCSATCHQERCRNGILDRDLLASPPINEQCDDGNATDDDRCSNLCTVNFCGDGKLNNGEVCDSQKTPATCNLDCTASTCGDGKLNTAAVPPEQCDDGGTDSDDGCSPTCQVEFCGDEIINNGEDCDRAQTPATCNFDCTASTCGDGKLNADAEEQCDDGGTAAGDGCSPTCQFEHCGNGVADSGEECDGTDGPQPCSPICHQERCGNGIVEVDLTASPPIDEQCDNGDSGPNKNDKHGSCTLTCQVAFCGDGLVRLAFEQCDNGSANGDDGDCTVACRTNVCGDGLVDSTGTNFEECDEGQANTDDPVCPYNTSCQRCGTTCTQLATVIPVCGDGVVHGPEEICDDHNTLGCGSAACDAITSQRAIGFIVAVSGAQLLDGQLLTIADGVNDEVVFEFDDNDDVTAGHFSVPFTGADDATAVQQSIVGAIITAHAEAPFLITAHDEGTAIVALVNDRPTTRGNQAIVEDVVDPMFIVIAMQGGAGGNCVGGIECQRADDCESHSCTDHVCD